MVLSSKRKRSSLKRRKPFKNTRQTVLLVCEGEKTEPNYFKFLKKVKRISSVLITICGKECGSAPISVVDYAIEERDKAPFSSIRDSYDIVWCIFDVENPHYNPTLNEALTKAHKNNILIALSNPCFEFWFLLHFANIAPPSQNCDEIIGKLKQFYGSYAKSDTQIFETIYPNTKAAIEHSKTILNNCIEENVENCNPSTSVHKLVEYLLELT